MPIEPTQEQITEAAMCLWGAVVTDHREGAPWQHFRKLHGTVALRFAVMQLAEPCSRAWLNLSCDEQERHTPFDWEWCPHFINNRVIWLVTGPIIAG